jgi:hypothetical protein
LVDSLPFPCPYFKTILSSFLAFFLDYCLMHLLNRSRLLVNSLSSPCPYHWSTLASFPTFFYRSNYRLGDQHSWLHIKGTTTSRTTSNAPPLLIKESFQALLPQCQIWEHNDTLNDRKDQICCVYVDWKC